MTHVHRVIHQSCSICPTEWTGRVSGAAAGYCTKARSSQQRSTRECERDCTFSSSAEAEVQAANQFHSHLSKVINPPKLNFHALTLQSLLFRARKPDEHTINHLHRSTLARLLSLRLISAPTDSVPPNKAFRIAASLLSPFRSQVFFGFFFPSSAIAAIVSPLPRALLPFAHTPQC